MSVSLIPESAPFTADQRSWLNGFFAGWLGLQAAPAEAGAAAPSPAAPAAPAEEFPWHEPTLPIAERLKLAEGRPLERRLMAAMAQLDCGACGYVCKTYAEAIASGTEMNLTLCAPGGAETAKTLKRLVKEAKDTPKAAPPAPASPAPAPNGILTSLPSQIWTRSNPYPACVLRSVNLNGPGSAKRTHHVEIDLGESGLSYEVGDALGVLPTNCPELVDAILAELEASGQESIMISAGRFLPLRVALLRHCCLSSVNEELLATLARAASRSADALNALIEDDSPLRGSDLLDVLRRFPDARPDPSEIVAHLADLRPRLYSISSSPKCHPHQVHITVGRVCYEHQGRLRKGVASTMLADRLEAGDIVRVFVHKAHGFTVPADPAAPMIMIGPGTGIAPFRAFLQERAAIGATGPNWLFFGDQHAAHDFLYRDELDEYRRRGLLTRLDTAFSRDQEAKVYVQHRMAESGAELFRWLEAGAHVYVCGDARRMAVDVDRALHEIIRAHGRRDEDQARSYLTALTTSGRYCRDVY